MTSKKEKMYKEIAEQTRVLRRTLKRLSKNQLIEQLFVQVNLCVEQQNINKVLLERLKTYERGEEE